MSTPAQFPTDASIGFPITTCILGGGYLLLILILNVTGKCRPERWPLAFKWNSRTSAQFANVAWGVTIVAIIACMLEIAQALLLFFWNPDREFFVEAMYLVHFIARILFCCLSAYKGQIKSLHHLLSATNMCLFTAFFLLVSNTDKPLFNVIVAAFVCAMEYFLSAMAYAAAESDVRTVPQGGLQRR